MMNDKFVKKREEKGERDESGREYKMRRNATIPL
jgi:hypothetical protein